MFQNSVDVVIAVFKAFLKKKTQTLHITADMSRKIPVFCFTLSFYLFILCFFFPLDSIEVGYSEVKFVGRSSGWCFYYIQDLWIYEC